MFNHVGALIKMQATHKHVSNFFDFILFYIYFFISNLHHHFCIEFDKQFLFFALTLKLNN